MIRSSEPIVDCRIYVEGTPPQIQRVDADGELVTERVPYELNFPKGARRVVIMLDADGNVVRGVKSCAGSAPGKGEYADYMTMLWAKEGWFQYGRCPLAQVLAGEVLAAHLPKEMRDEPACAPGACSDEHPCEHMRYLEVQRKAKSRAKYDRINAMYQSNDEKILAATQNQVAATQHQTEQIATAVGTAVAKAVADAVVGAGGASGGKGGKDK